MAAAVRRRHEAGTGGTGGAPQCYSVAFTAPTNGATLTVADDTEHDLLRRLPVHRAHHDQRARRHEVQLFNNGNTLLGDRRRSAGGAASFAVQLTSQGQSALSIQFPSTAACSDPTTQSTVTVNCPNTPPTCNISEPTISGTTHPR